jgi:demethylmenaquinone methyltransferase/2-methoxy-6-polyprenyl-1,4-benzoquinol methylase
MKHYQKSEPDTIQAMFDSIATHYDRTNALLSFQLHRRWNRELVHLTSLHSNPDLLLDLCCGTGEIALTFLKTVEGSQKVVMVDFSQQMLECAQAKALRLEIPSGQIHYLQADVQELPIEDQYASCATMAYGIRNVKDPLKCFKEVYRVLKPKGVFGLLELTRPSNPFLRIGHQIYLRTCLPLIGKWLTHNQEAYRYLCSSIRSFTPPQVLASQLEAAGFRMITLKPLTGGIATLLLAQR